MPPPLLEELADLAAGAVAVVGEDVVDEDGDAAGAEALVEEFVEDDPFEVAGPLLDVAFDVLLGDGDLLGLVDGVAEPEVGVGVGPPILATTMMVRQSLLQSLPRFLSVMLFLCWMLAQREWPAMSPSPALVVPRKAVAPAVSCLL